MRWLLIWWATRSIPFSIPVLPPERFLAYEKKMGFTPQDTENHDATILPQFYADRFGWSDLVAQVNTIYHALPPEEQAVTGIFAGNYGAGERDQPLRAEVRLAGWQSADTRTTGSGDRRATRGRR